MSKAAEGFILSILAIVFKFDTFKGRMSSANVILDKMFDTKTGKTLAWFQEIVNNKYVSERN